MIHEIMFGELQHSGWFFLAMTSLTFILMLFFQNHESAENNLHFLNQMFLYFFGSLIIIVTQKMFFKAPEVANLFVKSIFVSISQEEQIQINQLNIPSYLILLNTVFIASFSYFGIKVIEKKLYDFANFLTQSSESRISYLKQLQQKHITWKGLLNTFIYASFMIMLSILSRSCT